MPERLFRSLTVMGVIGTLVAVGCIPLPWNNQWLAFYSSRDGNFDVYKMRADGSQVTRLTDSTHSPASSWLASWSADGNWIAFTSDRDGNPEIYKMRADGSRVTRLTNNPAVDRGPLWAP